MLSFNGATHLEGIKTFGWSTLGKGYRGFNGATHLEGIKTRKSRDGSYTVSFNGATHLEGIKTLAEVHRNQKIGVIASMEPLI